MNENSDEEKKIRLELVEIQTPCTIPWESMHSPADFGNSDSAADKVRFCNQCEKNVYNISRMSEAEAKQLLQENDKNLCIRMLKRADGTVVTDLCPPQPFAHNPGTGVAQIQAQAPPPPPDQNAPVSDNGGWGQAPTIPHGDVWGGVIPPQAEVKSDASIGPVTPAPSNTGWGPPIPNGGAWTQGGIGGPAPGINMDAPIGSDTPAPSNTGWGQPPIPNGGVWAQGGIDKPPPGVNMDAPIIPDIPAPSNTGWGQPPIPNGGVWAQGGIGKPPPGVNMDAPIVPDTPAPSNTGWGQPPIPNGGVWAQGGIPAAEVKKDVPVAPVAPVAPDSSNNGWAPQPPSLPNGVWVQGGIPAPSMQKHTDSGVRTQVLEGIVKRALAGDPWKESSAVIMQANSIMVEDVEEEVNRRRNNAANSNLSWASE